MRRNVLGSAFVLCLLAFLPAQAEQKPWLEVKSAHFRVLTDASMHDARDVAAEFEQMRYVFASHFPGFRLESGAPLTIFVAKDLESAKALAPAIFGKNERVVGFYRQGWEKKFAVVRMDDWLTQQHYAVYHEYVHNVFHLNARWLPAWLDDGLAEFYSCTRFQSDKIVLGAPTERFATLRSGPLMPVETLLSVDGRSKIFKDPQATEVFYADSWALVHYLVFGTKNSASLDQFFSLLQNGVPQKQAFVQVFGEFKIFDQKWSNYMNAFTFLATSIPALPRLDEKSFGTRKLSIAETELELGAAHLAFHDRKTGESLITDALRDDPKLGAAHEEQAYILFHDGNDSHAIEEFQQAYALDGTLYRSLFAKTMLSPEAQATDQAGQAAYLADLQKVTELNPLFAPAFIELAKLAMRQRNYQLAFDESRKAESLEPSRAGYHLLTGKILLASERGGDAIQFAQFVAERWHGSDHDEAVELWDAIPAAARPTDVKFTAHELEQGEQSAAGIIKTTQCGDANRPLTVEIAQDGKTQTFYHHGSIISGFSDTFWWGEDHFMLCRHLEGKRAIVYYRPETGKGFTGEMTRFEIRDDQAVP
jgi:Tfp pilus assembly protein PilF